MAGQSVSNPSGRSVLRRSFPRWHVCFHPTRHRDDGNLYSGLRGATPEPCRSLSTCKPGRLRNGYLTYSKQAPGADENAENLPQERAPAQGGVRGYAPAVWCAERLRAGIRVISPEELVWRIRMEHDPAQTKRLLSQLH
jgi:hypothetical protein